MFSSFKHNHPIIWRAGFVVIPFAAGIATYFAIDATAPSYAQSIRRSLDTNFQHLRDLPVIMRYLGPNPSTETESPIDTLMKHYATLKGEPVNTQIVSDTLPQHAEIHTSNETPEPQGATWNTTNAGDNPQPPTLDMGIEPDGLLFQLAESTEANTRIRALEALSDASGHQAVRSCIEALLDPDPTVRRHASHAMARADGQTLYQEWVHVLQNGPIDLRQALDTRIPQLQQQLESSALAGLVSGDSDQMHKLSAIYTLGRIRSGAALPLLTGYAWSGDIKIAQTATAALAEIRSLEALGALIDLTAHRDADVRWYAINGLGILRGDDALGAIEAVIESGLEPVQEIRVLAVNHLGSAKDTGSIPTLIDTMDRYPGLRHEAMYALSQITGIQDFNAPFLWRQWYKEWSVTPDAQAAARKRRRVPTTQVAVMPVEATTPPPLEPESPAITPTPEPVPAVAIAPPKPAPREPLQVKKTDGGGSFGTSDLSPAELMRRGGFSSAKP